MLISHIIQALCNIRGVWAKGLENKINNFWKLSLSATWKGLQNLINSGGHRHSERWCNQKPAWRKLWFLSAWLVKWVWKLSSSSHQQSIPKYCKQFTYTECANTQSYSLMNVGTVHLQLLYSSSEFIKKFLIRIEGEKVVFSEQEPKPVSLCPAQTVTRRSSHGCDCVLDIHHGAQLTWT